MKKKRHISPMQLFANYSLVGVFLSTNCARIITGGDSLYSIFLLIAFVVSMVVFLFAAIFFIVMFVKNKNKYDNDDIAKMNLHKAGFYTFFSMVSFVLLLYTLFYIVLLVQGVAHTDINTILSAKDILIVFCFTIDLSIIFNMVLYYIFQRKSKKQ